MRIPRALTLLCVLGLPACAGDSSALQKELASMRDELGRIRAQNNILTARIETLEIQSRRSAQAPAPPAAETPAAPSAVDSDRPSLDVVRLAPEPTSAASSDTAPGAKTNASDDDAPRPVLRSTGRGEVVAQGVLQGQTKKAPAPRPAQAAKGTAP